MNGNEANAFEADAPGNTVQTTKPKNACKYLVLLLNDKCILMNQVSELMSSASELAKHDSHLAKKPYKTATFHSLHSNSPLSGTLATTQLTSDRRDELLAYIKESNQSSVIYSSDQWVLIKDLYPKASVHCLLIPKDPEFYTQHPYRAFANRHFLQNARNEVNKAVQVVSGELRRLHGSHSKTERIRIAAMESDDPPDVLPQGRDWSKEIIVGVHGYPSMNHLHIHVLSKDRFSPYMKHAKHYNTFQTKFFVPLEDFPLDEDDERWQPEKLKEYTDGNLICWRCDKNFKRSFAKLKDHLAVEFGEWRKI